MLSVLHRCSKLTYNAGIGKGLVEEYLARPNTTVIASVRNPGHSSSRPLFALPRAQSSEPTKLIIIKRQLVSCDAATAVGLLQADHHITKLDIVVANAGIAKSLEPLTVDSIAEVQEHSPSTQLARSFSSKPCTLSCPIPHGPNPPSTVRTRGALV